MKHVITESVEKQLVNLIIQYAQENQLTISNISEAVTEPLPAKADRFSLLLKQPKVFALNVIFFHLLLILFQSYQSCFSLVGLDFECRL